VIGGVLGNYRRLRIGIVIGVALMGIALPMHAALTVLVGEPFGTYGTMMPVGHTAIYLDRVCADGPLHVRMCGAGEQPGVVLARYHAIGPYDWLAVPVMEFLYATARVEDVPRYATPEVVWEMLAPNSEYVD
jgi:hypothetical protein